MRATESLRVPDVNPYVTGPFGASGFHLLTVIDFLCLAGGTYLLLIMHDRHRRGGYLLTAGGLAVLALQIIPEHLAGGEPELRYAGVTLALAVAGVLIAWGTLALVDDEEETPRGEVPRALLIGAAILTVLGTVFVWALPFWEPVRNVIRSAATESAFMTFQHGLRVGVAAALLACTWINWERRVLGDDISRMFGVAYLCWSVYLVLGVTSFLSPVSGYWAGLGIKVLGSLFVGNALVMHVYRAERTAAERQRRLALIDRVTSAAIAAPRLWPMIEATTTEVCRLLGARLAATYLVDREDRARLRRAFETESCVDLPPEVSRNGAHPLVLALEEQRAVELALSMEDGGGEGESLPGVALPLMGFSRAVGVMVLGMQPGGELSDDDIVALQNTAAQLGVIVQHMILLEEIREARDRWQQTFDSITELVTVHDARGNVLTANQAALRFAGLSELEASGLGLSEMLGADCGEQEEMLAACMRTGGPAGIAMHRMRGRVFQVQVTPLRDGDHRVAGCVRVARDITSRWRAEERLAQSERRYRELAEGANDIIYTHDLDGNLLYANPAAVKVLGYSQEQLMHLSFWDIVAPESMAKARSYVQNLLEGKPQEEQIELRMTCEDGRLAIVQLRANVLRRAGHAEAVHGIARDVTAEKQLSMQLIQADRLASVGTLIAGVAHELNNPLAAISGYAELLVSRPHDDEADQIAIATIAEEAARCRDVAQNLLNFARQTEERLTEFDLNALVRGVFDLRAYDLRAARIEVVSAFGEDLPPVVAEYGQIQQVVYNLIDNAYYALQQAGGGTIEVATWHGDGAVFIRVSDDGPGIPEKLLDRVFEPFVTTKPRGEGTGLGLSICKRILEGHGGTIGALNRPGGGASFTASLPVSVSGSGAPAEEDVGTKRGDDEGGPERPEGPVRVLFIDDEPSLCALVSEYLGRLGHEVTVADTGEEGLTKALESDFDAIICDMRLPGMSGEEVCNALLEQKPSAAERVVVATGDILSPQTQGFFDRTGLPHIHKPFKLEELEGAIARLMSGRPAPTD